MYRTINTPCRTINTPCKSLALDIKITVSTFSASSTRATMWALIRFFLDCTTLKDAGPFSFPDLSIQPAVSTCITKMKMNKMIRPQATQKQLAWTPCCELLHCNKHHKFWVSLACSSNKMNEIYDSVWLSCQLYRHIRSSYLVVSVVEPM